MEEKHTCNCSSKANNKEKRDRAYKTIAKLLNKDYIYNIVD